VNILIEVFITMDRNLPFEQNLAVLDLAVLVLQALSNRLADIQELIPKILAIVDTALKGAATVVNKNFLSVFASVHKLKSS
jgi:hypothetical protein